MSDMSAAANRPLNWNLLQVYTQNWDNVQHQLTGGDIAAERGGRVLALTLPDSFRLRINFTSGFVFDILTGWDRLMALPVDEKLRQLRDPATRAEWDRLAQSTEGSVRAIGNWAGYVLLETFSPETKPFEGRIIGDVAKELGKSAWDTMADVAVADGLRTVFANQDRGQDDATWKRRVEVWRDPRAVVGASDAGAHLDMIDSFSFSTTLIAKAVREHALMPVEEAVHHLTARPGRVVRPARSWPPRRGARRRRRGVRSGDHRPGSGGDALRPPRRRRPGVRRCGRHRTRRGQRRAVRPGGELLDARPGACCAQDATPTP